MAVGCYRCGKALPNDQQRVYSSWTRHYYCIDLDACQRRYERRLQLDEAFRAEQEQLRSDRLARVDAAHELLAVASEKKRR